MDRLLDMEAVDESSQLGHHLLGADVDELPREAAEARLRRVDGATVPIEYRLTPLPENDEGLPSGWVVVFRDISQRLE